jgi:hypothetical protein
MSVFMRAREHKHFDLSTWIWVGLQTCSNSESHGQGSWILYLLFEKATVFDVLIRQRYAGDVPGRTRRSC